MSDLLPCPFCGGEATLQDYTDRPVGAFVLSHKEHGCVMRINERFYSEESAIAAWNSRAPLPTEGE